MALITDRVLTVRETWLTVDVTWDDNNLRLEEVVATYNVPAGYEVYVALNRGGSPTPWREATFTGSGVWQQSRPFGGGFNTFDQVDGYTASWAVV